MLSKTRTGGRKPGGGRLMAIAVIVLASCACAVAAQSLRSGGAPASGAREAQTASRPVVKAKWPDLPRCQNPDLSETTWRALVADTHLVPDAPASLPTDAQVRSIQGFLLKGHYEGWCHDFNASAEDKRTTGPFINGMAYGTHSRVTVFYSNEIVDWLKRGRKGAIPDGAVIVKTMYSTPAYVPAGQVQPIAGYAVMVRSAKASHDGWLWLLYFVPANQSYHFEYLTAQYGASFCLSCHAQTTGDDMTFADLSNLTGHAQTTYVEIGALVLPTDATHPAAPPIPVEPTYLRTQRKLLGDLIYQPLSPPLAHGNSELQAMFASQVPGLANPHLTQWEAMPEDLIDDHIIPKPAGMRGQHKFLSSDSCVGCHDASDLLNNVPPRMTIPMGIAVPTPIGARTRYNLSPYGEWSASLMSHASRDPLFRAQYEAELTQVPAAARDETAGLCMRCHGPMGERNAPELAKKDPKAFYAWSNGLSSHPATNARAEYGGLARDGVSCTVCHQMSAAGLGKPETWSGNFHLETKHGTINGPFDDPTTRPMKKAIGMTPTKADHIKDSGLCGSCHVLEVPVYRNDDPRPVKTAYEQTTYLEWANSDFSNPTSGKTCAACHMPIVAPTTFDANGLPVAGAPISTQIANLEDGTFPFVPNRASPDELATKVRSPFGRHTLVGLNNLTHAMFQQFPQVLGVGSVNFGQNMTLVPPSFLSAQETLTLADGTVKLGVSPIAITPNGVEVNVTVINQAGHKFPSGVGFRRAWLEVKALDEAGKVLWCSGCTDGSGLIVDGDGKTLPGEFATVAAGLMPDLQRVDSQARAQIYEIRHEDCEHQLTNSFMRLCASVKDNRILPKGWSPTGLYADVTRPVAARSAARPGQDTVKYVMKLAQPKGVAHIEVRMLYQAMPPYYLVDRFRELSPGAAPAPEASRLYYLATHLNIDDPNLRASRWRLEVTCADVKAGAASAATKCL
jgi:hypothetical protein